VDLTGPTSDLGQYLGINNHDSSPSVAQVVKA
jgi:hypothetical protein